MYEFYLSGINDRIVGSKRLSEFYCLKESHDFLRQSECSAYCSQWQLCGSFSFCMSNNVSFQAQWIPRAENQLADYLSRIVDPNDWSLSPRLFRLIVDKWGPFHVDRMASHHNSHLPRFNSKFWCPSSEAVDCFHPRLGKRL